MRTTRTMALLELSPAAYDEIFKAFESAGYEDQMVEEDGHGLVLDMHGIGVSKKKATCQDPSSKWRCTREPGHNGPCALE